MGKGQDKAMTTIRKVIPSCCILLALLLSGPVSASAVDSGSGRKPLVREKWYSIQVASSVRLGKTEDEVALYRQKGCDAFYRYEDTGSKGMWYRIYIGRYHTKAEAGKAAADLIEQKIVDAFVLRKISFDQGHGYTVDPQTDEGTSTDLKTDQKRPTVQQVDSEAHRTLSEKEASSRVDTKPPAPVETASGVRLSLLDAIRYGLEGNREIEVVSYDPKQALEDVEIADSVYDTRWFADATYRRDPDLETSVTDIVTEDERTGRAGLRKTLITGGTISTYLEVKRSDVNNRATERTYKNIVAPTVELRQPLLNNIGSKKERTAIKIAKYEANISDAAFRQKVNEVASQIASVYWKLYLNKELVKINQKNLDLAEEVHRREAERFAKGISQRLDVERARSSARARLSTWLNSVEEYQLSMDRLKLLLNRDQLNIDADTLVLPVERPRTSPVKSEVSETIAKALCNRPEIIKAREYSMIRKAEEDLAEHQKLPKLDIIGRYSVSGYGDNLDNAWDDVSMDDDDAWEVGIQFEWAIGRRSAKSAHQKKTLARRQTEAQVRRIADNIKLEVKQVLQRLETLQAEIKADRSAKEAAEKVVEGEFIRFEIGSTSNEELLRAQDLLAVTSRSLARSIIEYNIAVQELAHVQGLLPEGIAMDAAGR
jgi:outer membrane protein TolC